jgi:hypothetical protein
MFQFVPSSLDLSMLLVLHFYILFPNSINCSESFKFFLSLRYQDEFVLQSRQLGRGGFGATVETYHAAREAALTAREELAEAQLRLGLS